MLKLLHITCLLVLVTLTSTAQAHQAELIPSGVGVEIRLTKTEYTANDTLLAHIKYTNLSKQPISLLKWNTGLNGHVDADFLDISRDGVPIPYHGPHFKRRAPQPGDYAKLAAGESITASVDLEEGYAFSELGSYLISARVGLNEPTGVSVDGTATSAVLVRSAL